jgi:hypothetical protein
MDERKIFDTLLEAKAAIENLRKEYIISPAI